MDVLTEIPCARPTSENVPVDDDSQEVYSPAVLILQKETTSPSVLIMFM